MNNNLNCKLSELCYLIDCIRSDSQLIDLAFDQGEETKNLYQSRNTIFLLLECYVDRRNQNLDRLEFLIKKLRSE